MRKGLELWSSLNAISQVGRGAEGAGRPTRHMIIVYIILCKQFSKGLGEVIYSWA